LAVSKDCQGQGVGRSLIEAVEAKALSLGCGKLTLEVREDNDGAQRLYRRLGFGNSEVGAATFFLSKRLATQ
jgi:ribosomal protein S18 acetylase RimI-like enzyme